MKRTAILGASGYVGAELLRLCAGHPLLRPTVLFGESQAGAAVESAHPGLPLAYPGADFAPWAPERLDDVDLVFAALPHGRSQDIADEVLSRDLPFVDLGADFRLNSADEYAFWYGESHRRPELLSRFVYGLPEIAREAVRTSRCVAAAGCYPTAAILAMKPLVDAGLARSETIIVDAASGLSGAGRALKAETAFTAAEGSMSAYGLVDHRHTAEMEMGIGGRVLFTPHLAPMSRGILATCYAEATGPLTADAPLEALKAAYANEPFIHVSERPPATKWTLGSNAVHLTARYDGRTGRVLTIAALDNLVKGAAGQMIQCANLMLGLEETSGLPITGMYP